MFRDDSLTVESLDGNRLYLDSKQLNLECIILPHSIVENFEVEYDHSLLEDNDIYLINFYILDIYLIYKFYYSRSYL